MQINQSKYAENRQSPSRERGLRLPCFQVAEPDILSFRTRTADNKSDFAAFDFPLSRLAMLPFCPSIIQRTLSSHVHFLFFHKSLIICIHKYFMNKL